MGSPGVESRARVAEGRALGLGSVRAVPVEPACGPGQRVVEEPAIGGPEGPQANRSRSGVKAKVCNEERGGGGRGGKGGERRGEKREKDAAGPRGARRVSWKRGGGRRRAQAGVRRILQEPTGAAKPKQGAAQGPRCRRA